MLKQKNVLVILTLLFMPLVLLTITLVLYYNQNHVFPDSSKWCIWDCGWYNGMREHGYIYKVGQQNNLAFFPLFPLVWKILSVGNIGIGIVNYCVFALATFLLSMHYKIAIKTIIVFMAVGLSFFFMVPYTESFFFLGAVLIILGFNKNNYLFLVIGALIAIGTRSASMIFLVSFVAMLLLVFMQKKKWHDIKTILFAMLAVFIVNAMVFAYQYQQTGRLFGCFEAHQYWDHYLRWPKLVHISWHKPVALTENFALFVGLFCMLILVTYFFTILSDKYKWLNPLSKVFVIEGNFSIAELFALLYLSGGTSFILLYQQESLASINRYVLSTPFYLILLHLLSTKKIQIKVKPIVLLGLAVLLSLTISHSHIEHKLIMIVAITLTTTTVFITMPNTTKFYKMVSNVTCLSGILLQGFLFHYFISGNWVG